MRIYTVLARLCVGAVVLSPAGAMPGTLLIAELNDDGIVVPFARFDGTTWSVFTNLGGGATNVSVRGIGVDSSNRIWTANNPHVFGNAGGVSMYDGTT